jgi:hypothetical protein
MKRTAALVLMLFAVCTAYAQSFSVDQQSVTAYGTINDSDFNKLIRVYNNTSSNLQLQWVRTQQLMPPTWRNSVCNEYYCFPMSTDTAMFTILAGDSDLVDMHFYPYGTAGSAAITVRLSVVSDPSDSMSIVFYGNVPVGIDEQASSNVNVYPNPVADKMWIDGLSAGASVEIYNSLGQQLRNEKLNDSRNEINTGELLAGYYVMRVLDKEGRVVVKRFVKQ